MKKKNTNLVNRFLKRRRTFNQITTSIVISAVMALSACVPLPIPWPGDSPRYSSEQIAKIREGYSSRDEVVSVLGAADIQRLDNRYWVYHWKVESGRLIEIWLGVGGGVAPLVSKQFILFLEFNEKGILLSKQFGDKTADKYCTASGLCLDEREVRGGHNYLGAYNMEAFTISGSSKDSVPWPALGGDRCVVVLWLDAQDWKDLQGLRLFIANPPQSPLIRLPDGSYSMVILLPSWLPVGSYMVLSLPTGKQTVRATAPYVTFDSVENFQCEANQTMYMEIGKISKSRGGLDRDQVSIVLKTIDPETGRKVIAEMPRLLPPYAYINKNE